MRKLFPRAVVGTAQDRIDGKAKVTGAARYAAEYKPADLLYGVLVSSTIAKGRIVSIDSKKAESIPGVIIVLSHLNRPEVPSWTEKSGKENSRVEGQEFRIFFDDRIYFDRQPVALVVAETLEKANEGVAIVKVRYQKDSPKTNFSENIKSAVKPKRSDDYTRGSADAYQSSPVKIEADYTTPLQIHNPMEMHAATCDWSGSGKITHYNKTQAVKIAQGEIKKAFQLNEEDIEVHSPFVGGAFGSSSRVWPPEMAAILASKKTGRPVTVMAKRDQVFNLVGYRPASSQKIKIGADKDGTLISIYHEAIGSTSSYEEFTERMVDPTKALYACPNMLTSYKLVSLDMSTPCWTRGPGETSGSFALESAMDELAYKLNMDPVALRIKNFATKDFDQNLPWSTNYLKECYQKASEKFGWARRNPTPGSMSLGDYKLGMGMSAGIYKATRSTAAAGATFNNEGVLIVQTSVADVGPGSATIMTQIAADGFGIDPSKVKFEWGNSKLPPAPGQFGSHTTASTGSAVYETAKALQKKISELATTKIGSPFFGKKMEELSFEDGTLQLKDSSAKISYLEILNQNNLPEIKLNFESKVEEGQKEFSAKSFCAHYVEVLVHPVTGQIKVSRVVSAIDAGKIMNQKTAVSQVYGSIVWGIGIALMEEGIIDHRYGRYINNNLADYHVPVNADIPNIDVIFINEGDFMLDPIGAKGLGEIGLVGLTAAIANAIYHATGKRIRNLPISADKLL